MQGGSDLPRLAHRRGAERHAATEPAQIRSSAPQDDKAIAEAFAQQAYTAVGNRDREIMRDPYLLGFEIVTKNEENTRLVGVFAFRVSGEILLVPVFYLNGQIKGQDLLYRKGVNRFCPNTDKWIAYLLSRSEDTDGRGINRQGPDARIHLNINQLAGQNLGFKSASADEGKSISELWKEAMDAWAVTEPEHLFANVVIEQGMQKQAAELAARIPEWAELIEIGGLLKPEKRAAYAEIETYVQAAAFDAVMEQNGVALDKRAGWLDGKQVSQKKIAFQVISPSRPRKQAVHLPGELAI